VAAKLLAEKGSLTASDVSYAASHGDPVSLEVITNAGRLIGRMLAGIVNLFNPSLIVIGGGVAATGDVLLATIRESVYRRSLPLATRDLTIKRSALDGVGGVIGAAAMVTDELFAPSQLARWIDAGTPRTQPVSELKLANVDSRG
jgi:predicted NBD/HSP70 family sugar kinase